MLLIAQPRSGSTSLMDTIGKVSGINACQKFNNGFKSYKKMYGPPEGFDFIQHHHSDFRAMPFQHVLDRINDKSTLYKQHIPPTKEVVDGLRDYGKNVVILLRNPEEGMNSYKKLGVLKYKESLQDLKLFNETYLKLASLPHILIVTYDEIVNETVPTLTKILNHYGLPVPPSISGVKLSKNRTESDYSNFLKDKKIAFVGPAPSLKGKKLGEKIDSYDVVVRMKQPIIPENLISDYGKKTDVIYCNLDAVGYEGAIKDHYPKWKENNLKWVCMARRKKSRNARAISSGITSFFKFHRISKVFYGLCKKKCKCSGRNIPFTGTVGLIEVLNSQFKELFITGFDFYRSARKGACGHYDGFNTKSFESGVNYKKYYQAIYSAGNPKYRHNANNDIVALKKEIMKQRALGKVIILGEDISGVLGIE